MMATVALGRTTRREHPACSGDVGHHRHGDAEVRSSGPSRADGPSVKLFVLLLGQRVSFDGWQVSLQRF